MGSMPLLWMAEQPADEFKSECYWIGRKKFFLYFEQGLLWFVFQQEKKQIEIQMLQ